MKSVLHDLLNAKRPLLLYGWGVRLAGAVDDARDIASMLDIPIVTTWAAADMFPEAIGSFGTHGVRAANFAVQNADFILCVGSRLDTKATGSPASSFAPKARILMVDIDPAEIAKMEMVGRQVDGICMDAAEFFYDLRAWAAAYKSVDTANDFGESHYETPWNRTIRGWTEKYPACLPEYEKEEGINPYVFVRELSNQLTADDVIVSDTGCSLGWMMQGYRFKGERFIHAFNQTPMGYGLPAALGACLASGRRVCLVTGDGGLSLGISELATAARHQLPIKVILFNNRGHAMCRQTQRQWLGGEYPGTSYEGGLACPDFVRIAHAYGIRASITNKKWMVEQLKTTLGGNDPALLELPIAKEQGLVPQARFGAPLEDQEPALPREELAQIMEAA